MKPSRIITQTNTQPRTKSSEQWSMTTTTKETMHTNNTFTRLRRNRRTTKKPHPARQVPIGLPRHTKKSMHITTATVEPHRPEKGTSKRLPRPSQTLRYDGHTITATGNKPNAHYSTSLSKHGSTSIISSGVYGVLAFDLIAPTIFITERPLSHTIVLLLSPVCNRPAFLYPQFLYPPKIKYQLNGHF